jgi:AcrR family transcriptional regulator
MPRPRRAQARTDLAQAIKDAARQQMAERGTAGLSLRGIARALGITAPAIYHYYPRLDDLLTALLVDAFTAIAQAMAVAVAAVDPANRRECFRAATLTYRAWALAHPVEFQLLYGNPIPGYAAPEDVTTPLARRPFSVLGGIFVPAWRAGEITLPFTEGDLPPSIVHHLRSLSVPGEEAVPVVPLYALIAGWAQIHGLVTLELFHHLQPVIGDPAALFDYEVTLLLDQLGFARVTRFARNSPAGAP